MTNPWETDPDAWKKDVDPADLGHTFFTDLQEDKYVPDRQYIIKRKSPAFMAQPVGDSYEIIDSTPEVVSFLRMTYIGRLSSCDWFSRGLRQKYCCVEDFYVFIGVPYEYDTVGQNFVVLISTDEE